MNKTKKILGIPIAFFVIGLLVIGGASAAIVSYLSNTVTATVEVKSPMELTIGSSEATLGLGSLSLGTVIGGESTDFYVSTHNKANVAITGTMWNVVSNPEGMTCDDFTSLTGDVKFLPSGSYLGASPIGCVEIDANSVRLITTPTEPYTWSANSEDVAHVIVTFDQAAHGSYTVNTHVKN